MLCLFGPAGQETVSDRVERRVTHTMFEARRLFYNTNDTKKEESINWYMNWLFRENDTRCQALEQAVHRDFSINEDEFVNQILKDAYTDLQRSDDPAVLYYLRTLTYLPKGSQNRNTDAVPEVEWFSKDQTRGMVVTPGGTHLGYVERGPDGGWAITPEEEGLVRVTEIAKALGDAKDYLVNRLTKRVTGTTNGKSTQLRIITQGDYFMPTVQTQYLDESEEITLIPTTYQIEFWNAHHGFVAGAGISVELPIEREHVEDGQSIASVLEGMVVETAGSKVSISGRDTMRLLETPEN